jgi:hypothetical protein
MRELREIKQEFPEDIENISKDECAKILHKALGSSGRFSSIAQLASAASLPRQTVGDYFFGRHKPPKDKWIKLRLLLLDTIPIVQSYPKAGKTETSRAAHEAERLRLLWPLLKDYLQYFRDSSPEDRAILKKILPGTEAGYISGLLSALYDEDQLAAWLTFAESRKGGQHGRPQNRR